jgi:hypothetical protein
MPLPPAHPHKYEEHLERGQETNTKLHHHDDTLMVGDEEVFEADFFDANGNKYSSEGGIWKLVRLPNLWHGVVTHKWPKGDLAVQILQDFDKPAPWYFAIMGGSGDYQGARGQITYVSEKDITFRFSTTDHRSRFLGAASRGGPPGSGAATAPGCEAAGPRRLLVRA